MASTHRSITRAAIVAVALLAIGAGMAIAGNHDCNRGKRPFVGAFTGVPTLTVVNADGKQTVDYEGIGAVTDLGDVEVISIGEVIDPTDPRVLYGCHKITGDHGDTFTIEFTCDLPTLKLRYEDGNGNVLQFDGKSVPVGAKFSFISFWAEWSIKEGTGCYRKAKGEGRLYVDAWCKPIGDPGKFLGSEWMVARGIGEWAMWGEVERVQPSRRHCGWFR